MGLLFFYSLRNLLTRRLTTILTASGMALVVFVFASILMLAEGLQKTLVETGSYDNVVVIRRSSGSEVQSGVDRVQASIVETQPEIAAGPMGRPLLAKELVVLITMEKRESGSRANVVIRGISEDSFLLRPQVRVAIGRIPKPGSSEIVIGRSIEKGFQGADLGKSLFFAMRSWTIVGVFDAGSTGFSSEIWGDADQLMQAFRRPVYSSLLFRLREPSEFDQVKNRIESDPRLTLEAKRETTYYKDQSEMMAKFLRILGFSLTIVFSIGAVVGGMITMYASVANRTREIGTLRALGFTAHKHSDRLPDGIAVSRVPGRNCRTLLCLFPPVFHGVHHQFPDLLGTRLQFFAGCLHYPQSHGFCSGHGFCGRNPACLQSVGHGDSGCPERSLKLSRLLKNAHLRRCPHPSSPRRTGLYVSLLRISGALYLSVFEQPASKVFFGILAVPQGTPEVPRGTQELCLHIRGFFL